MCQTLFTIPAKFLGIDVFGVGWLLAIWALVAVAMIGWSWRRHGFGPETRGQLPGLLLAGAAILFLLPRLSTAEGLPIRGYGVMLLLALVASIGLAAWRAERLGLDPDMILSLAFWLVISGIVGARVFYIIEYWSQFQRPTLAETLASMANIAQGGLVVYGSLLAGGAALVAFVWRYRVPGLALSDLVAPSVVLGVAVGRIGCFLNGCCYGGASDLPWSVSFPWGSPAHIVQIERGQLPIQGLMFEGKSTAPPLIASVEPDSPAARAGLAAGQEITRINGLPVKTVDDAELLLVDLSKEFWGLPGEQPYLAPRLRELHRDRAELGQEFSVFVAGDPRPKTWSIAGTPTGSRPIHPTQLYSFIDSLLLCLFLLAYYPYRTREGEVSALTMTLHPISRFLIEIIRVDEQPVFSTPWSISQNISLLILVGAVCMWIYVLRQPRGVVWPVSQPATTPAPRPLRVEAAK
ncbi:MAG TPA: prolipoprotein diacylglyceryl transferase family protein [Pirellulales bacterium]|nr:prolipoprotein diacylglyceryl transferase family protein [Pirellulales bacterium]